MFDTSEPEDFQEPGQELDVRVASLLSMLAYASPLTLNESVKSWLTLLAGNAEAMGQN